MLGPMSAGTRHAQLAAPGAQVAAALLALYFVWGSTYIAIRVLVETVPPLLGAGVRFVIAGAILYAVTTRQSGPGSRAPLHPTRAEWRDAAIIGAFLLAGGNGLLNVGEVTVPSGIAALIVATMPMWVAVFGRIGFGMRVGALGAAGIALGLVGVAILVWPTGDIGRLDPFGALVVLGSPILWAIGSLYSRRARHPASPLVAVAMQMLAGGALLVVLGLAFGELGGLRADRVTPQSLAALAYLIGVGSLVGYTAYGWLLRVAPLSLISTYAYVNPVVAVILGAIILGEPITPRTILAGAVILAAVAVIVWARGRESAAAAAPPPAPEELVESS
jgi:drug/metabolite transporter (DMT)-like permease